MCVTFIKDCFFNLRFRLQVLKDGPGIENLYETRIAIF